MVLLLQVGFVLFSFKTAAAATLQHSNYDTHHHQFHQLYNQLLFNMRAPTRANPRAVKSPPGAPSSCQQKWFGQVFYFMITIQCNLKITLQCIEVFLIQPGCIQTSCHWSARTLTKGNVIIILLLTYHIFLGYLYNQ